MLFFIFCISYVCMVVVANMRRWMPDNLFLVRLYHTLCVVNHKRLGLLWWWLWVSQYSDKTLTKNSDFFLRIYNVMICEVFLEICVLYLKRCVLFLKMCVLFLKYVCCVLKCVCFSRNVGWNVFAFPEMCVLFHEICVFLSIKMCACLEMCVLFLRKCVLFMKGVWCSRDSVFFFLKCMSFSWNSVFSLKCVCLSWNVCAFRGMCVPFVECVCLSWNVCAFRGMCLPFLMKRESIPNGLYTCVYYLKSSYVSI